jgi:hypothetical protein
VYVHLVEQTALRESNITAETPDRWQRFKETFLQRLFTGYNN